MKLFKEFVEDLELDEGAVKSKEKTVTMVHKTSGKEIVVVDTPKLIKGKERLGFKVQEDLEMDERELSDKELEDREHNVKRLKKHLSKFKARYGKDGESIMYAIATRDAKRDKKYESKLDELSKKLLKRYSDKASKDIDKRFAGAETEKDREKLTKRLRGYAKGTLKYRDKNEYVNYPYGPLDTMRPMADLGDIPNYYGTKLNAQRKKKKVNRDA